MGKIPPFWRNNPGPGKPFLGLSLHQLQDCGASCGDPRWLHPKYPPFLTPQHHKPDLFFQELTELELLIPQTSLSRCFPKNDESSWKISIPPEVLAPPSPQKCGIEVIPESKRFFQPFPLPAHGQVINIPSVLHTNSRIPTGQRERGPNPTDALDVSQYLCSTQQEKPFSQLFPA